MRDIIQKINSWPLKNKVILLLIAVLSITSIILFFAWHQKADYHVLYSNLSEEDSGQIIQKLKDMKVPYKVTAGGIMVPSDKVYDIRLELASQGLPQGGGVGFELFDKTSFAMTDFVQKLNYRRALQGELSRTIAALTEVEQCRVHLAVPEKSLFARDENRPKASVLVKLKQGRRLSQAQVQGIVHLVSSSVEGLDPKDVVVVDEKGEMLTSSADDAIGMTVNQLEYQRSVERDLESRIISILEPVVGKDKVRAKVAVNLDFTRIEKTEERYDPDGQVIRSEQRNIEKSSSGLTGGVPGVSSNLPNNRTATTSLSQGQSEKKNETINYEISKVISRTINSPGDIKRISVVALVDGIYTVEQGSKEKKYSPRSEEELKKIEEMVKNAVGFLPDRGDDVRVVNMQFETIQDEMPETKTEIIPIITTFLKYLAPIVAIALFFFFILKPLIKTLSQPPTVPQPAISLPKTVAEIEKTMEIEDMSDKKRLIEWAKKNPKIASSLVKEWIEEK